MGKEREVNIRSDSVGSRLHRENRRSRTASAGNISAKGLSDSPWISSAGRRVSRQLDLPTTTTGRLRSTTPVTVGTRTSTMATRTTTIRTIQTVSARFGDSQNVYG